MRIAKVIGTVTLSRWHPSMCHACYRVALPMTLDDLTSHREPRGEELIVYDDLGAGNGSLIAFSEGGEAAQPFHPNDKPVDAYNAAILDSINL